METVQQWRAVILPFTSEAAPENPFLDVEIWAVFTGPGGQVIRREAYWDGGRSYKVAFAPTAVGRWRYCLQAPAATGLDGAAGEVECVPYTGGEAIYQHGFLKVSDDRHYLTYADGTPFFWLGDTHWEFAYGERWDESNHPGMTSMFRGMVDRRVQQGFTVYQTNLRSDIAAADGGSSGNDLYWDRTSPTDLPNVAFYQQELDRRMQYVADRGLVNAVGVAWFSAVLEGTEHIRHLVRYLMARYGALPVVWTLAGEAAGYFPEPMRSRLVENWREVALYQQQLDGYGNLQTAHSTNERPFVDVYQDEEWFDFTLNQAGHGDRPINAYWYQLFHAKHGNKPFVEGESFYEFVSTLEENGTRLCTADMVRRAAYIAMQTGACGYTYGAQGIWDNVWEKGGNDPLGGGFNQYDITWAEAIDGEGAVQMGYLKQFYLDQRFWELAPHSETKVRTADPFDPRAPLALKSPDGRRWVLYYAANLVSWRPAMLHGLNNGSYRGRWFDPRTGAYTALEQPLTVENGTLATPNRPTSPDWLLVLEQA